MRVKWLCMALTACVVMVALFPYATAQEQTVTSIRIAVTQDGSARWAVEHTLVLSTPADVDAWNQTYASGREAFLQQFQEDVMASVARASQVSGRAMAARDFGLEFRLIPSPFIGGSSDSSWLGCIAYAFTWDGFAEVDGGTIFVGDAFVDGYYLQAGDALYVSPPEGFTLVRASPSADAFSGNTAVWFGDVDTSPTLGMRVFNPGFPQARIEPSIAPTTSSGTPSTAAATTAGTQTAVPTGQDGSTVLLLAGAGGLAVIAAVTGGVALRSRRRRVFELPGDRELLLALLRRAGGQAYQSELVAATGFSEAKVSLLLKQLHREGVVAKVRRGNRNVIRLR